MYSQADVIQTIRGLPWFLELTDKQVEALARISSHTRLDPGQILFNEGDQKENVYIVLEGQISVENLVPGFGPVRITTAEALDVLGWTTMTPMVRQRTATTRAISACLLLEINGPSLKDLCEEDHDLGYIIMKRLANIAAGSLLATRLQLYDLIIQTQIARS